MSDFPSYPREAAERETAVEAGPPLEVDLAGWGRRAGAYLLDLIVLLAPPALALGLLFALNPDDSGAVWAVLVLVYVAMLVLPFAYFTILHGNERGQTLGKRALGIRVVSAEGGGPIGYGRAFGRYFIQVVFGSFLIPALVDYLWPLWDSKNQTLHDKAVRSLVVRV